MKNSTMKDRINYKVDSIMSKGTISLILFLAIITACVAVIAGVAIILIEKVWADESVFMAVWKSFTLTLDPGNLAGVKGSVGLIAVTALVTLSGIFITSTLISIINTGLSKRLDDLRRGNARILEKNHTVILGFNESVFSILSELQIANENVKKACIVILGQEDKQYMEEQIMRRVPKSHTTRIVCRSGDTTSGFDLARCSLETCKSIIVNQTEDSAVIRVIMASANYLKKHAIQSNDSDAKQIHITASVNEYENLEVAKIAGQGFAEVLHFNQVISRIMAHVCYQPGLSSVYMELFDFSGDEIYIESFPTLVGRTFQDAYMSFDKATIIGISREKSIVINPTPTEIIQQGDLLVLIASDDGVSVPTEAPEMSKVQNIKSQPIASAAIYKNKHLLILGANNLLPSILSELDTCLPPNSSIIIAGDNNELQKSAEEKEDEYANLNVEHINANVIHRGTLEKLISRGISHILILSDTNVSADISDAKTLTILLQIRDLAQKHNLQFGITSEMLDIRNQELAQATNVSDFVISRNISSLMLTQISENRLLAPVFLELLDSAGAEISLKPSSFYIKSEEPTDIYTVAQTVFLQNELFIGYKKVTHVAGEPNKMLIVTNIDKNEKISFTDDDWLIVITNNK